MFVRLKTGERRERGGEERRERDCTNALVPLTRISEYGQEFPNDDFFFLFFLLCVKTFVCLSCTIFDIKLMFTPPNAAFSLSRLTGLRRNAARERVQTGVGCNGNELA